MVRMLAGAILALVISGSAIGGPALDEIMNPMKLDQTAPNRDFKNTVSVSASAPVGVSFVTGSQAKKLCRIAIGWGPTGESWTEDESLVLTVWDSEKKQTRVAEYAMPFKFKQWEGATVMFPLWVAVEPNAHYYFELTVKGGDGTIDGLLLSRSDYAAGKMTVGGKPQDKCIWFETHVKDDFDKDAAYADQFANWNLDYPGFEKIKAAVQGKSWDTACNELVAWYEGQEQFLPKANRALPHNPRFDLKLPDLAASQQWEDLDGKVIHIGPDWNYLAWWEKRGGVGLTRSGLMQPLSGGYRNTGDEKYAKAYNDMMLATCRNQPSPLKSGVVKSGDTNINPTFNTGIGGGTTWSALSIAPRANQALYWYSWFVNSPSFTQDARCAVIFSQVDMTNVLAMMKGGGNWETQIKSSLFGFGNEHREFAHWKDWFNRGKDGLFENLKKAIQPDGALEEPTPNYHALSVNRFLSVLETCKELNSDVPEYARSLTERGIDWLLYITQGNGIIPAWGDTWQPMTCNLFERGYKYFGREDYRWMTTGGKEGREPSEKSKAFPNGGWYVMRSGWGPDDLFLMTHNGPFPGHGHNDRLAVVAYAYGSELLIDPGIYSYGSPEAAEISKSRHHSTVTIDDLDTVKRGDANKMVITPGFDYYCGTNAGYINDGDARHTRQIVFVKPSPVIPNAVRNLGGKQIPRAARNEGGYWVLRDTVTGSGKHVIASRFEFPQKCETDFNGLTARAKVASGAGIDIALIGADGFALTKDPGEICIKEHLYPIPVARFSKEAELPVSFTTLLHPYPKGKSGDARASELKIDSADAVGCSAASIRASAGTDCVVFGKPGVSVSAGGGKFALDGEALVVRTGASRSVFLVNGTSASVDGKRVLTSDKVCSVSVIYKDDTALIDAQEPEPSLQVLIEKAAYYRVNSGEKTAVKPGATIRPFK